MPSSTSAVGEKCCSLITLMSEVGRKVEAHPGWVHMGGHVQAFVGKR